LRMQSPRGDDLHLHDFRRPLDENSTISNPILAFIK